jgi:hypothetical protein
MKYAIPFGLSMLFMMHPSESQAITLGEILSPYQNYFADCDKGDANLSQLCSIVQSVVNARLQQAHLSIQNGDLVYSDSKPQNQKLTDSCEQSITLRNLSTTATLSSTASVTLSGNAISKPVLFGITLPVSAYARADMLDQVGASVPYIGGFPPRIKHHCVGIANDNFYADATTSATGKFVLFLSLEPVFAISSVNHFVIQLHPIANVSVAVDNVNFNWGFHGLSPLTTVATALFAPFNAFNAQVSATFGGGSVRSIFQAQTSAALSTLINSGVGAVLTDQALGDPLGINSLVQNYVQDYARNYASIVAAAAQNAANQRLKSQIGAALNLDANGNVTYSFDFAFNQVTVTQTDLDAITAKKGGSTGGVTCNPVPTVATFCPTGSSGDEAASRSAYSQAASACSSCRVTSTSQSSCIAYHCSP